jgi:hypothetical protein
VVNYQHIYYIPGVVIWGSHWVKPGDRLPIYTDSYRDYAVIALNQLDIEGYDPEKHMLVSTHSAISLSESPYSTVAMDNIFIDLHNKGLDGIKLVKSTDLRQFYIVDLKIIDAILLYLKNLPGVQDMTLDEYLVATFGSAPVVD